ncbi:hypothetical protein EDB89DRAFT_483329 [Lactarius sanguifluus]|nr:hypothetical protein EDB89DRAFT_483329 [Lactarius sanguifluus]
MGGEVAPPFSPSTRAGEPPAPVYVQMGRGKGHERESTQDSPPRLCEWGTAWEAPLSAACPRFSAKEAREPGVAPPLPAQERRAKTGRRTGKGVRKRPHAPFAPTFAPNGGPGRRTSRAGEPRVTGSRCARGGTVEGHARTGGGGPRTTPEAAWGPLLFSRFTRGAGANEGRGRAGMGRGAPPFTHSRAPPFVRSGGGRADPRHPAQVAAQG